MAVDDETMPTPEDEELARALAEQLEAGSDPFGEDPLADELATASLLEHASLPPLDVETGLDALWSRVDEASPERAVETASGAEVIDLAARARETRGAEQAAPRGRGVLVPLVALVAVAAAITLVLVPRVAAPEMELASAPMREGLAGGENAEEGPAQFFDSADEPSPSPAPPASPREVAADRREVRATTTLAVADEEDAREEAAEDLGLPRPSLALVRAQAALLAERDPNNTRAYDAALAEYRGDLFAALETRYGR